MCVYQCVEACPKGPRLAKSTHGVLMSEFDEEDVEGDVDACELHDMQDGQSMDANDGEGDKDPLPTVDSHIGGETEVNMS